MAFSLPDDLAGRALDRLRLEAPATIEGAALLLARLSQTMPSGSTAKNEAIDRDEVPPGADPAAIVEKWLERPGLGWSCWASSTVFAALLNHGGGLRAEVIGTRRVDPQTAPVDFHSAVEITDGADRWITDTYFGFAPIRAPGGDTIRPGAWAEAFTDGVRWRIAVGAAWGRGVARYRSITAPLTATDVEAFCRVSVTHSGVGRRDRVQLDTPDGSAAVRTDRSGVVQFRRWRARAGQAWEADAEIEELSEWAEAERRIAELATAASF